jgi:integrase
LREWKLACPPGRLGLAFPNQRGNPADLTDIVKRCFHSIQIAAGWLTAKGRAKYGGLHTPRHFYAS